MKTALYAKEIEGGYEVINIENFTRWTTRELPKACPLTGRRIILNGEVAERIIRIANRTQQLHGFVKTEIIQAINRHNESILESEDDERLARIYAYAQIVDFLDGLGDELVEDAEEFAKTADQELGKLVYSQLRKDGQVDVVDMMKAAGLHDIGIEV